VMNAAARSSMSQVLLGKASGPAPVTYPWVGGTRKETG